MRDSLSKKSNEIRVNWKTFETARANVQEVKLDFIHTTNVQNLSYSLKVNEFLALTTSKSMSRYTGYKSNNVWNGLKRVRTREHGECSDPWSELSSDVVL